MTKQIYIRGHNYGGEMTIGEVTKEFVEYWQPICKEEGDSRLIDHLMALKPGIVILKMKKDLTQIVHQYMKKVHTGTTGTSVMNYIMTTVQTVQNFGHFQ